MHSRLYDRSTGQCVCLLVLVQATAAEPLHLAAAVADLDIAHFCVSDQGVHICAMSLSQVSSRSSLRQQFRFVFGFNVAGMLEHLTDGSVPAVTYVQYCDLSLCSQRRFDATNGVNKGHLCTM